MGTNYYLNTPTGNLHIGKSSCGWKFLFDSNYGCNKSFKEWRDLLELHPNDIIDEYERKCSLYDFYTLVYSKQTEKDHGIHATVDAEGFDISVFKDFS